MNVRVSIPSLPALSVQPPRPLLQASIVPIADRVAGLIFDVPGSGEGRARLTGRIDGAPIAGPLISTSLKLQGGGRRHLLLLGKGADALIGRAITLALGAEEVATVEPDWLQPPLADGAALIDGLSEEARRRLLKLFLTTGASLFGFGQASEFSGAAGRLLDLLGVRPVGCGSACPVGGAGTILSYRLPAPVEDRVDAFIALSATRAIRLPGCRVLAGAGADAGLLHVYVPQPVPGGAALIGLGPLPLHLLGPDVGLAPQPLVSWMARRDDRTRHWVHDILEVAGEADPLAAATVRELVHCRGEPPALAIGHISGTGSGILHALTLSDPHDLVRAVRIERSGAAHDIDIADGRGIRERHLLEGYAPLPRRWKIEDSCRIRLVFRSGRVQTVEERPLEHFTGGVPSGFSRSAAAVSAVARARIALDPGGCAALASEFGPPHETPALSVIADVPDDLDLLRCRAAMLFTEAEASRVELVHVVPDGALAEAARRVIADTSAIYGAAQRLVLLRKGASRTDRLLAAIETVRSPRLLLLGADVLPAEAGWLAPWLRHLDEMRPLLGGTLIDHAGAVLDIGGRDELRGLPAADLPRIALTSVERPTAACVGLIRDTARQLLSATPYPNPDLALALLAKRLDRDGREPGTLLRCRFVRYGDATADPLDAAADAEALRLTLGSPVA